MGGLIKFSWSLLRMEKLSHLKVTSAKSQACTADGLELWCSKPLSKHNYTQHKSRAKTWKQILKILIIENLLKGREHLMRRNKGDASTRSPPKPLMLQRAFLTHRTATGSLGAVLPFLENWWMGLSPGSCSIHGAIFIIRAAEKSFDGH